MTPRPQLPCPLLNITSSAQLELRGRLLSAARQRFTRFSREETSLSDIARIAGVPETEARLHFADVYAVMVALERALTVGPMAPRGPRPNRRGFQRDTTATRSLG
jgi:hypothetical protein